MSFPDAQPIDIRVAVRKADAAFRRYRLVPGTKRAVFLDAIAAEIEALGPTLIQAAMAETHLPEARLMGERARTLGQLRLYAGMLREGSWVDARIAQALPDRTPLPRPDLRRMLQPLGPVVVFGSSNFPFAYSTAGGDTASALAAGCPVIVKAHPGHPNTSTLVAGAIERAARATGMPEGVFGHVYGAGPKIGAALVKHPLVKAVGFTGSFTGGKALFDLANRRKVPIPVFAEMGSVNPVFLFPEALQQRPEVIAQQLADSIALGVGQFCTNPGLVIAVQSPALEHFIGLLGQKIQEKTAAPMLHGGIADSYRRLLTQAQAQEGVHTVAAVSAANAIDGAPAVMRVEGSVFLKNKTLHHEIFGPASLVVACASWREVAKIVNQMEGQLTATLIAEPGEMKPHKRLLEAIQDICGRLVFNGVPTGVEVHGAMQHGGPFPASTDARFSAVGDTAIYRWVRPVSYQNFPDALLPEALKEHNPLKIKRKED